MNKIYKVVWSKVKNCYVVVSEIAKNVITGSVKSAKVGAAPMVKGMAMGVVMACMMSGSAWANDSVDKGYEYSELEKIQDFNDIKILTYTIPMSSLSDRINGLVDSVNGMGTSVDALDDNITAVPGSSTTVTTSLTVNGAAAFDNTLTVSGLTTLNSGLNATTGSFSGAVTASSIKTSAGVDLDNFYKDYETQLGAVSTKLDTSEVEIGSLKTTVEGHTTDIASKASQADLTTLADRVTTNENSITLLSNTQINQYARISVNTNAISAMDTAYKEADTALSSRIDNNTTSITANASAIDAIEADYLKAVDKTELAGSITANASTISAMDAAYKAADTTLQGNIDAEKTARENAITGVTNAYSTADDALSSELKAYVDEKTTGIASEVNLAEVQNKTQNIVLGENGTEAGKTVMSGDLQVGGNVQAATFNGLKLEDELAKKVDNLATKSGSIAIGGIDKTASADNCHAIAIGENAESDALCGIAIGLNAKTDVNGGGDVAIGENSLAAGGSAVAFGKEAKANGGSSVAIGNKSTTDENGVAIGNNTSATGGVAIGVNTIAATTYSIAIGTNTSTGASDNGIGQIAMGYDADSAHAGDVAIGMFAKADSGKYGYSATAVGREAQANGKTAVAYGFKASAGADRSTAVGAESKANNLGDLALGSYSATDAVNSVQSVTVGSTVFDGFAGYSSGSEDANYVVVAASIGGKTESSAFGASEDNPKILYRQLQYVAAGQVSATSADAVNGSQLYAAYEAINSAATDLSELEAKTAGISRTQYDGTTTGETKVTDDFIVDTRDGKGKVTIGYFGDYTNGYDEMLFTTNAQKEYTFGVNAQTGAMQANGGAEFGYIETDDEGKKVYNVEMNAEGVAIKSGFSAVEGKVEVKADEDESALINVNKGTENQVVIDANGLTVGQASVRIDNYGVYAGAHDYNSAFAAITSDGRIKGANGAFTVDASGNVTATTYNGYKMEDLVAAGNSNADAITKLQEKDTELAGKIDEVEAGYQAADTALENKVTEAYTKADAELQKGVNANKEAIETEKAEREAADAKTLTDAKAYADGKEAALNDKISGVEAAYKAADETLKAEVTDAYTKADEAIKDDVKTNADAIDGLEKTKADVAYVDEVKAKVEADYQAADAELQKGIEANAEAITKVEADYKAADAELQKGVDANAEAITKVEADYQAADAELQKGVDANAGAIAQNADAINGLNNVIGGLDGRVTATETAIDDVKQQAALNDRVNQVQNTQIAQIQQKDIAQDSAIAGLEETKADVIYVDEVKAEVEAGYKAADAQTLADAKGYTDEKAAEVTEAYTKADEAIKADVKTNADAIEANATAIGNVQGQADANSNAINGLNQRLGKMNGKINKVGAGAAALAALHPLDYDPDDKLTFAAGVGNYAGENAAALGAFYRPDEKLMFSLGGTMGNGENMVNLGVSIGLDGAKGTPKLSKKELVEKVSTMEAANKSLQAENEALAERVARLERIVVALTEKEQAK